MRTKPNIRWQLLLAIVCLGLVLSLLSYQVQTASLCSTRVPAAGGSLAEGVVGAPRTLNPLLAGDNLVDRELVSLIFDGLTRYNEQGELVPALATSWEVGEEGRTVTFTMAEGVTWHDGEPVTAADVVFTYRLLQDETFPAPARLRAMWQPVTIEQQGDNTVTFTLPEPYSPFLDATTRGILPAHLLGDVPPGEIAGHDFNQHPVGTGPFMVPADSNWRRSGRLHLLPNPSYWRQGVELDSLEFRFYPDFTALLDAYRAGELQAINNVPPPVLPEVAALPHTRLYSAPLPRYTQLLFNLGNEGAPALDQSDVRHALGYALDREQLLDEALNGQGIPLQGPYLPGSWAYNPGLLTLYGSRPLSATQLLEGAGWILGEGERIRQQDGELLSLRLLFVDAPGQRALADAIASQWAEVGVASELRPVAGEAYATALSEGAFDVALTEVRPPGDPDLYDFWSQEALVRGQNYAGWNSRRASEALEQARQLWEVSERRPFYDAFLQYFNQALPALSLYQHVYTYAVSDSVQNLEIGRIDHPRDRYETLAEWFLLYRDVTVSCPENGD